MSFAFHPAKREATPCMIGIVGPSGTGKTFSALRMATGMQRINGGDIGVIDTEGRRALHYADQFKFLHMQFDPPFSPQRYLEAIEFSVKQGIHTLVIDSMSHEWESEGGVLEMAGMSPDKAGNVTFSSWIKPKAAHRKLINRMLQMPCSFILCFRAQEKLKIIPGAKEPEHRGFQPITDEKMLYEMTVSFLLEPGANGVPSWHTDTEKAQRTLMKLPMQFRGLFEGKSGVQLNEEIGQRIAEWSAGIKHDPPYPFDEALSALRSASESGVEAAGLRIRSAWKSYSKEQRDALKAALSALKGEGGRQPGEEG